MSCGFISVGESVVKSRLLGHNILLSVLKCRVRLVLGW